MTLLRKLRTFTLFFLFLDSNICSSRAGLFIFGSVISAPLELARWLNSVVSDSPVFSLAAGDGGSDSAGPLSGPVALAGLPPLGELGPRASHTAAIHCRHTQYGLFGRRRRCQECRAPVPLWEKKKRYFILRHCFSSPSFPLKKFQRSDEPDC